jgi:hypothetical protein
VEERLNRDIALLPFSGYKKGINEWERERQQ